VTCVVVQLGTCPNLSLKFTYKSKSWILDQMLVYGRTYLIQVFQKLSIDISLVEYPLCMNPCVVVVG